jgi:hypothetical protein
MSIVEPVLHCYPSNAAGWVSGTGGLADDTLVLHLIALTCPVQVRALLGAVRAELIASNRTVLIVDSTAISGATFDAIWELEALILNLPEQLKEWRQVPCGSPALLLALRRMLRLLQSRGITCGLYSTYAEAEAVGEAGAAIRASDEGRFHAKAGDTHRGCTGALVIDLATAGTEFDLAVLIDSVVHTVSRPDNQQHTVIFRIQPGTAYAIDYLAAQIDRVQRCDNGAIVVVVDESGRLAATGSPQSRCALHLTNSFEEALAHLDIVTMSAFRLGRVSPAAR